MEDAQQMSEPKLSNELRQIAHDIGIHGDPTRFHQLADMAAVLEAKPEAMEQDTARLDWLERECALYVETGEGLEAFAMLEFGPKGPSSSLRAAIDWAAQQEKEE